MPSFKIIGLLVLEKKIFKCFTIYGHDRKIGQGQPRVTIYINFVELESPMKPAKFQDHRAFGSGEEDFLRFLPYIGMAAILVI